MSLNCYEIIRFKKNHAKLKNLLYVLAQELGTFLQKGPGEWGGLPENSRELWFIFFLISHISIIIYCYGFYFDLIGNFEFQLLIGFYFNSLRVGSEISYHLCNFINF